LIRSRIYTTLQEQETYRQSLATSVEWQQRNKKERNVSEIDATDLSLEGIKQQKDLKKQELLGGVKLWEGFVRVMLMKIKSLNRRVQESVLFADETSPCEDS